MNIEQKKLFLSRLQEYFKNKRDIDLNQKKLEWYWQTLCDYSLEDISSALKLHDRDSKRGGFPPKPSDIISKIENFPQSKIKKIITCQFSHKLFFEGQCKNAGDSAYGREIFRPSDSAAGDRHDRYFDVFENEFWLGRRTICVEHFYFIRDGGWILPDHLKAF